MKHLFSFSKIAALSVAAAVTGFSISAYGTELVPLNEFENELDFSANFTVTAGFTGLSVAHSSEDDGGIGRGGFVELPVDTGATSNIVYDTDGTSGTQAFGDATIVVDQYLGSSIGFIVRGNASRNDGIRVLMTNRARVRVWTEANPSEAGTGGTLRYDETGPAAPLAWNHLRLSMRNVGGDRIELVLQVYNSQARFNETTLVAEHNLLLDVAASAPYLSAGEIGFNMFGVGNRIDNFAVYEHGTAPASRPHPELTDFFPRDHAQYHDAADGLTFRARSPAGIDETAISLVLNGMDVSASLEVTGDPEDRTVHLPALDPDTDYVAEIEAVANSGEITTRRIDFRTETPPVPVSLVDLLDFAEESDFTGNFTPTDGTVAFVEDWDRGIGRGGFVRGSGTSNTIYDTDGTAGTQVFGDFSATLDTRVGSSTTFIIRANRETDSSIRVTLTNPNRMRIWTGSSISSGTAGPLVFDQTAPAALTAAEWVHLRLDVRNVGPEFSSELEVRLRAYVSQTDLSVPAFDMTHTIPNWEASGHIEPGEVGFRTGGGTTEIDNFAVYEYGAVPVWRPHPEIFEISPEPGAPGVPQNAPFFFEVTGTSPVPQAGVQLIRNGTNVSGNLAFTGDELHWFVAYPGVNPGDDILIEATADGATTTAFWEYPPMVDSITGRPRIVYDAGGFEDDSVFPPGDLQHVQHGNGEWTPHSSVPAQIVEVEEPFNTVLRVNTRNGLNFPEHSTGILTLEMDLRVSSIDVRTLDLSFTHEGGDGTQRSFVGWGTVAGHFTYYDGSNWIPLFEPGTEWRRYKMVNYLSGPYASSFDLFVDGELVGEKLTFRSSFDPSVHNLSRIRLNASSGDNYAEIDNLVLTSQLLMGADQLPFPVFRQAERINGEVAISFETYLGFNYLVEYTDELGTDWTELITIPGNGGLAVATDSSPAADRRFYRATTLPAN